MEFDLLNKPHPHPLIFYPEGKPDGNGLNQNVMCSKCNEAWRPPAFSCPECNFHIHLSCIDLPAEIHTPIHPHPERLSQVTPNNNSCDCCNQMPYGNIYKCPTCPFLIDIQCAIANPKASCLQRTVGGEFRHFTHHHPLILQQKDQRGNRILVCFLCKSHVESGSTYFCSLCNFHLHQHCAERPREIIIPDFHSHPLFFFAKQDDNNLTCAVCKKIGVGFSCIQCNFAVHVACVSLFKHKHELNDFQKVLLRFMCGVCGCFDRGIPWICKTCQMFAHKKCVELPSTLNISEHDHPLTLTWSHNRASCEICLEDIVNVSMYDCCKCKYIAHLDCAKYLQIEDVKQDMIKIDTRIIQENEIILHFSHKHKLSLSPGEDRHCDGCMRLISTLSQCYGCSQCDFYLHQECARLPRRCKNYSFFHSHELSMVYIPDFVFSCAVCLQYCHGFAYYCKECQYAIDIRCAAISFPFKHSSHSHPLSHYDGFERQTISSDLSRSHLLPRYTKSRRRRKPKCSACGEALQDKEAFECRNNCDFFLDFTCAHLLVAVRNRFDEHPLSLTFVNEKVVTFEDKEVPLSLTSMNEECDEYYCDICEKEREKEELFYSCKLCCFAAHINCVLGDYPFLKSARLKGHPHPLSLAKKGKNGHSACGECGDSCEGNMTFECGLITCKFNVHAFGRCYHRQLTQGRITFTMPSLRYRSIPFDSEITDQKKGKRKLILFEDREEAKEEDGRKVAMSLRQYGGKDGKFWDDRVFSSIKRVVITHGDYIHSIQTEYFDHNNGSFTWSDRHGGNGGITSEAEVDYPDEYLISIHGYMGDFEGYYMIRSLVFESNKRMFGPFGKEEGTIFRFPTTSEVIIVGFHGRSSYCLDSIGIKVLPFTTTSKTPTMES